MFALSQCLVLCRTVPCDITNSRKTCLLVAGFDDYQLATCSSNSILQQNGFRCEDSCTDTCWHLCMVEHFGQINGSVSSNCSCKPHFPALPPWCYNANGHCAFNNCTRQKYTSLGCAQTDLSVYSFNVNLCKILNDFFRYLFCETKTWLDGFRKCLQQYLIDSIIIATVSCSDLKIKGETAFLTCIQQNYSSRTFCDLPHESDKTDIRTSMRLLETIAAGQLEGFNITAGVQYLNCPST